jgi:hypothetical protein
MTKALEIMLMKEQLKSKHQTNHVLHLLLCIPTFGLWVIVWRIVAVFNEGQREAIDERFALIEMEALKKDGSGVA